MPDPGKPEKPKRVVALRYDTSMDTAPRVVAKGQRLVAERILEVAREHRVHVHEDPALLGLLSKLDINAEIPPELYNAVAEVLAFVYRLNYQAGNAGKRR